MSDNLVKERMDSATIAMRAVKEFEEGVIVNLGVGLPTLCSSFVPPDKEVLFHSENGVLGFGPILTDPETADIHLINAGAQPVSRRPGMSLFDQAESFCMVRGGHLDLAVLGALQVSERGDLANYHMPGKPMGSLGGGQDLAFCARKVIVLLNHSWQGQPRVLTTCSLPVTAPACVDLIITDIAVMKVTAEGLLLTEVAPGWTPAEIQQETEARLIVSPDLKEIELM